MKRWALRTTRMTERRRNARFLAQATVTVMGGERGSSGPVSIRMPQNTAAARSLRLPEELILQKPAVRLLIRSIDWSISTLESCSCRAQPDKWRRRVSATTGHNTHRTDTRDGQRTPVWRSTPNRCLLDEGVVFLIGPDRVLPVNIQLILGIDRPQSGTQGRLISAAVGATVILAWK